MSNPELELNSDSVVLEPTVMTQGNAGPAWLEGITKYHVMVFIGCWLGGIFDGMDSTLMSVLMPDAVSQLIHSHDKALVGPIASYVQSIFLFGWMLGGVLFGVVGDKLGRVKSMILSILLYALFTGLAGLSHSWPQLAACRFLTGLGIGGEMVSIATFLAEVWPSRTRAVAIGVLITSYQAGVFIAGSIQKLVPDWRTAFFLGVLPAFLVIFLQKTLRESDKWMEAKQKRSDREEKTSHFKELFHKENARGLIVGGLIFCGLLIGYWASLSWIPLWVQDLVQGRQGSGGEKGVAVIYEGIAAVLGCSLAGFFSDWMGRKATIIFSYTGCLIASALLFLTNPVFSPVIYWETALLGFFIGMAQAIMYVYLPELFPTLVRASATGFCLNVGRFVTAVTVLFVGAVVNALGGYGMAAFAFSLFYLVSIVAAFFGVETRGRALLD